MSRQPWSGKIITTHEINCSDCDAHDMYEHDGFGGSPYHFRVKGWRTDTVADDPDSTWRCPEHAKDRKP